MRSVQFRSPRLSTASSACRRLTQRFGESILSQIPAGRFGNAAEIAKAVLLASDQATFTVGSELVIDGGMINL
jgi:NAD(P)-dependent dehydrogenase (short-subunit alcohol dehydrogenase family)